MSLGQGGSKKPKVTPQVNVTPLVDVVLVLLIIFMVVTPLLTKQFWIHVPKKQDEQRQRPDDSEPPLVLSLAADGKLRINEEEIRSDELGTRLPRIFAARGEAVLVFDAEDGAAYGDAVRILDLARAAGAVTIAVSPRELR